MERDDKARMHGGMEAQEVYDRSIRNSPWHPFSKFLVPEDKNLLYSTER